MGSAASVVRLTKAAKISLVVEVTGTIKGIWIEVVMLMVVLLL